MDILPSIIKQILTYEKYIGDAILQKTYTVDILEKKRDTNRGQVPKYYVENSHEGIIPRDLFLKVQEEITRRANLTGTNRKRIYSGKYALSGIVFCGHCDDIYRRIKWNNRGRKSTVWRCACRVEHGTDGCKARTLSEETLQEAVVMAINETFQEKDEVMAILKENIQCALEEDIENRAELIDEEIRSLQNKLLSQVDLNDSGDDIGNEIIRLREEKEGFFQESVAKEELKNRINEMIRFLKKTSCALTEYEEKYVRILVERITVYDDHLKVDFKSGITVDIHE